MNQQKLPEIKVVGTRETEAGDLIVTFDVSDEFKYWFKKDQGLTRWSSKRFEKFFSEVLENYLKNNDPQQGWSILVDGKPGEVNEEVEA